MAYESYGKGVYGPYYTAGPPVAGTNEVQTLTFGGTWAGGDTYRLSMDGRISAAIPWNATTATHLASIQAQLDAISGVANSVVATAGTIAAGLGTVLLTFSGGNVSARNVSTIAVTGIASASGTLTNAETTPGVNATYRDVAQGAVLVDITNAQHYMKTGAAGTGTYVKTGTQT